MSMVFVLLYTDTNKLQIMFFDVSLYCEIAFTRPWAE